MKFTTTRGQLTKAVTLAERVVGKNLSLSVLNNILINARGGSVSVRATNLDLGIEVSIPVKSESEGSCAVSGSILSSVLSTSSEQGQVTLSLEGGNVRVQTTHSRTLVKSVPVDDFPSIPKVEGGITFSLPIADLVHAFRSVSYSALVSSMKPELASVYISGKGETMTFVATDSFRLAEKTIPLKTRVDIQPIMVPVKNVSDIVRVLDGEDGAVTVSVSENQISFTVGSIYLTSRLIVGSFPDYKQIIPKKAVTEVVSLKQDLLAALKRAALFTNSFSQVHLAVSGKKFTIHSLNQDVGETSEGVPAAITGDDAAMNFNHRYITDCFPAIFTDSVTLSLHGASKPMVVRGVGDNSFLYLVMPMNR